MKTIYVAGPFRAEDGWRLHSNILMAESAGMRIAHMGAVPIIPHSMFRHFDRTINDPFWLNATEELLIKCNALFCLPSFAQSAGSLNEVRLAREIRIPVFIDDFTGLEFWLHNKLNPPPKELPPCKP